MKKLIIFAAFITTLVIGLSGCYKDTIIPEGAIDPDGPPQSVSFSKDLAPLFNTKCATTGCHASGAHKPYLTTTLAYQSVVNGGFVNTIVPKDSRLYTMINGEMKEYIPSAADRQKVYDWIRNGAPNN
jgi:hypothetical protein